MWSGVPEGILISLYTFSYGIFSSFLLFIQFILTLEFQSSLESLKRFQSQSFRGLSNLFTNVRPLKNRTKIVLCSKTLLIKSDIIERISNQPFWLVIELVNRRVEKLYNTLSSKYLPSPRGMRSRLTFCFSPRVRIIHQECKSNSNFEISFSKTFVLVESFSSTFVVSGQTNTSL